MAALPSIPGHGLDRLLGTGASATVWLAHPVAGGPAVALKVAMPGAGEHLRAEAAVLAELDDPGVVRSHGVVEGGDGPALVLDHVPGGSLAERLARRTRLTPTEAVELGVTLARTLHRLHQGGVVHGDVKPANVLLTPEGGAVLCDFGTPPDAGTEGYLDPAAGGPAADVHALGVTLHELLAGDLPRPGVSLEAAAPGTPPALVAVIDRAHAPDPADRPVSATALADQLATAILTVAPRRDTRTFGPRPPLPAPVAEAPSGRARRLVPVAAAALVAAGLAGPLSPFRGGDVAAASASPVLITAGTPVDWDGAVLTGADGSRYTLGVTGGEVVLGDWDCDGRSTPGHYDPVTGAAVTFSGWATDGRPLPGRRLRLPPGRHAGVATGQGCDRLVIR